MKAGSKIIVITSGIAAVALVMLFFIAGGPDKPAAKVKTQTPVYKPVPASLADKATRSSENENPMQPLEGSQTRAIPADDAGAGVASTKETIIEVIEEATVSYSASELPKIQPFLLHPDPEIRAAALQGFVTISEPAGAPLLRAAAQLAPSAEEAAAMRDAAAYIELPPASLLKKNGKASKQ